jgi:arginine-tRNA-protein transferase
MVRLSDQLISEDSPCPYVEGMLCRFEIFFAMNLSGDELEEHLSQGWRKFGPYYFKPRCECLKCVPVRTSVNDYIPSKDQRRNMRRNSDIRVTFSPLSFREEIFEVYLDHSVSRFGKTESRETFLEHFYEPSCPSLQSEFHLDGKLVAVGFLDKSSIALSSVYFCYRKEVEKRGLGIYSIIREILFAKELGLAFYYPGYYIEGNSHMNYKNRFHPCAYFDWGSGEWGFKGEENG